MQQTQASGTKLNKRDGETKLERVVRYWLNSQGREYQEGWRGAYRDLMHGGCSTGVVGKLIYYSDTRRFYRRHQEEIDRLLRDTLEDTGCTLAQLFGDRWDKDDPLAREQYNQNLLAWYGFEETAQRLAALEDED